MANVILNNIHNSFMYIGYHNLLASEDTKANKIAVDILEKLGDELGIIQVNDAPLSYLFLQPLYVSIKNDPEYIEASQKNLYLQRIWEDFDGNFNIVINSISDYSPIIKTIETGDGEYFYNNNNREKGIMFLELIHNSISEVIVSLNESKHNVGLTHPQQMLLLDKLGIIEPFLNDDIKELKYIAEIIALFLKRDVNNTRLYLTYGSKLSDSDKSKPIAKKYNYRNSNNYQALEEKISHLGLTDIFRKSRYFNKD